MEFCLVPVRLMGEFEFRFPAIVFAPRRQWLVFRWNLNGFRSRNVPHSKAVKECPVTPFLRLPPLVVGVHNVVDIFANDSGHQFVRDTKQQRRFVFFLSHVFKFLPCKITFFVQIIHLS